MWNKYIFSLECPRNDILVKKIKQHVMFDQIHYMALSIKKQNKKGIKTLASFQVPPTEGTDVECYIYYYYVK